MFDVACDNTAAAGGINKHSILDPAIRPLDPILLISAVFDIEIKAQWAPIEENVIAVLHPSMISKSWTIWGSRTKSSPFGTDRRYI